MNLGIALWLSQWIRVHKNDTLTSEARSQRYNFHLGWSWGQSFLEPSHQPLRKPSPHVRRKRGPPALSPARVPADTQHQLASQAAPADSAWKREQSSLPSLTQIRFKNKINSCYCFKPLRMQITCYKAIDNYNIDHSIFANTMKVTRK